MGVYTNEAKQRLGDDVWEEIMKSVNKGVIDEDMMQEIASSLTEKVGGNQIRRKKSNAQAMSDILSDWYKYELYDMDTETALKKLREIFLKSTLQLNILARFLKEKLSTLQLSKDADPAPTPPTIPRESLRANILMTATLPPPESFLTSKLDELLLRHIPRPHRPVD